MRTSSRDITIGQELFCLLVIILLTRLLNEFTLIIKLPEEIRCHLMVDSGSRAGIDIKRDTELLERFLDDVMVAIHDILRRNAFLLGTKRDGHTVLIGATNHQDLLTLQAEITCVNIGRHINTRQVSDMHRTVGIRQSRCYQCSFKMFLHSVPIFSLDREGMDFFAQSQKSAHGSQEGFQPRENPTRIAGRFPAPGKYHACRRKVSSSWKIPRVSRESFQPLENTTRVAGKFPAAGKYHARHALFFQQLESDSRPIQRS